MMLRLLLLVAGASAINPFKGMFIKWFDYSSYVPLVEEFDEPAIKIMLHRHNDLRRDISADWRSVMSHQKCEDHSKFCDFWAGRDECLKNPEYMLHGCPKACKQCYPFDSPCQDSDHRCPEWAERGECENNPEWMLPRCNVSCRTCPHDLPDIKWDAELAKASAKRVINCELSHLKWNQYGENIYAANRPKYNASEVAEIACDGWGSEKQIADKFYQCACGKLRDDKGHRIVCGHYTQMIWRDTTHVGCAFKVCSTKTHVFCQYKPKGNIEFISGHNRRCISPLEGLDRMLSRKRKEVMEARKDRRTGRLNR